MKPQQVLLNKAPNKGERTKSKPKAQKPKVGHKWAKEQIMFQNPHSLQEAYERRKMKGNLKV